MRAGWGWQGGQPAFSLVLHTWRQDLGQHLHLHAVMACGVLGAQGHWQVPVRSPDFLFPVRALSPVFRAKFMAALAQRAEQQAEHPGQREAGPDANLNPAGRKALYRHAWVVYAKTPLGGPAQVLAYLSRYSHRTAIGNERIQRVSAQEVVFTVRDNERGGKRREKLATEEFIRRLLLHVLPGGIQRIRHYGVLANGCKKTQLTQARQALGQPAANPQARESAQAFMDRVARLQIHTCQKCGGPLKVVATLCGVRYLPAPGEFIGISPRAGQARAPPC